MYIDCVKVIRENTIQIGLKSSFRLFGIENTRRALKSGTNKRARIIPVIVPPRE